MLAIGYRMGQQVQRGVGIFQGAVGVDEEAVEDGQHLQARDAEAVRSPVHLAHGAAPGAVVGRQITIDEGPVERRVVRKDEIDAVQEFGHALPVDALAGQVGVGDAGQAHDLGLEWPAGILQAGVALAQVLQGACATVVFEGAQADLDDLFGVVVQTGALDVDYGTTPAIDGVLDAHLGAGRRGQELAREALQNDLLAVFAQSQPAM